MEIGANVGIIGGIFTAWLARKILAGRSRPVQWVGTIASALIVAGALSFGITDLVNAQKQVSPMEGRRQVEQLFERLSPLSFVMKQEFPDVWEEAMSGLAARLVASKGVFLDADKEWFQQKYMFMTRAIWRSAINAEGRLILALAQKDIEVDEVLNKQSVEMCATRGDPFWDLTSLPPESLKVV